MNISAKFALPATGGNRYPSLQLSDYQPRDQSDSTLCFTEESALLLSDRGRDLLMGGSISAYLGKKKVPAYKVAAEVRWVPLGLPAVVCYDKGAETYRPLSRGMKLGGGLVSATRVPFVPVVGDELLMGDSGSPQVVRLRLVSTKVAFLRDRDPNAQTLDALNRHLQAQTKLSCNLLHLVSIELGYKFVEVTGDGKTSVSAMFYVKGHEVLPEALQEVMFEFLGTEEAIALLQQPYPFGEVSQKAESDGRENLPPVPIVKAPGYQDDDLPAWDDNIPF